MREVRKRAGEICARNLLEASENGNMELLKEMKRIKGCKKSKLDLPENVEGACGEVNIVEKFRDFYESVYNSSESNEALEHIKTKIRELIYDESDVDFRDPIHKETNFRCTKNDVSDVRGTRNYEI